MGLFYPPESYKDFTYLEFSKDSDVPHRDYMPKSLINNYDINYNSEYRAIIYDSNGGKFSDGKVKIIEKHKVNDEIKLKEAPIRDGYKFLYWKGPEKGSEYQPGATYTVKDNHIFVAQWKKISSPTVRNTPPELEVKDATITVGDELDLKTLIIKARDKEDGEDLIDKVVIDKGNFDNNKPGEYKIKFTLTDNDGASVTKIATVTVKTRTVESRTPVLEQSNKPKTGDNSHATLYITVVALAVLALALVMIIRKRHDK